MLSRRIAFCVLSTLACLSIACEQRESTTAPAPFAGADHEYVLAFVLDMSGSFAERMQEDDGRAYQFFQQVAERFFMNRIGANDRVVIAQLSADERTLLWEGTPGSLMQRFPGPTEFSEFLLTHSHPGGSHVYSAMAETLDYLMAMPGVSPTDTRVLTVVLSDMRSEGEDEQEGRSEVLASLKEYGKLNGALGLYWVGQERLLEWQQLLTESGVQHFHIESEIVDSPLLPEFE